MCGRAGKYHWCWHAVRSKTSSMRGGGRGGTEGSLMGRAVHGVPTYQLHKYLTNILQISYKYLYPGKYVNFLQIGRSVCRACPNISCKNIFLLANIIFFSLNINFTIYLWKFRCVRDLPSSATHDSPEQQLDYQLTTVIMFMFWCYSALTNMVF